MSGLATELWASPLATEVGYLREEIRTEMRRSYGGGGRDKGSGSHQDKGQHKDKGSDRGSVGVKKHTTELTHRDKGSGQHQQTDKGLETSALPQSTSLPVNPPMSSINPPSSSSSLHPIGHLHPTSHGMMGEDVSLNHTSGFNPPMGVTTVHPQHTYVPTRCLLVSPTPFSYLLFSSPPLFPLLSISQHTNAPLSSSPPSPIIYS